MTTTAFLHPFAKPTMDDPVTIVEGRGALVRDDAGREYVDALASLWYCNVGHGRQAIVDAVAAQMRRIAAFHTFDRFTNEPAEALAAELAGLAPFPDARVFLTSGGSEAVETAIKLARFTFAVAGQPERTVVISRRGAYHGVSLGALTATGIELNRERFGPLLPDVVHVPPHDLDALDAAFAAHDGRVAAVIAEPVMGAGGVYPPAPGELEGIRQRCDDHGALYVSDEVICGFGRLGGWWGCDRYGVTPDLVTFAKGVSSGYVPLGGVLVSRRVLDVLESDPGLWFRHGYTYSGHPTACVAGSAAIAITKGEGLHERAGLVGQRLSSGMRRLAADGRVAEVRGEGAVWAVGLHDGVDGLAVRDAMLERGVIARPLGPTTVAFCPPLVITDDQVDRCLEALDGALAAVRPQAEERAAPRA